METKNVFEIDETINSIDSSKVKKLKVDSSAKDVKVKKTKENDGSPVRTLDAEHEKSPVKSPEASLGEKKKKKRKRKCKKNKFKDYSLESADSSNVNVTDKTVGSDPPNSGSSLEKNDNQAVKKKKKTHKKKSKDSLKNKSNESNESKESSFKSNEKVIKDISKTNSNTPVKKETLTANKVIHKSKLPFDREVLGSMLATKKSQPADDSVPVNVNGATDRPKNVKANAVESSSPFQTLMDKSRGRLNAARFRYLNEQLYSTTGKDAFHLFRKDREAFTVYHEGFQSQVEKWPTNPLEVIIQKIKEM